MDVNQHFKLSSTLELRGNPWRDDRLMNELRYSDRFRGIGMYYQNRIRNGEEEFGLKYFLYF